MVYYNVSGYNSYMFLVGLLSWWYSDGWIDRVRMMRNRLISVADFFSIGLLVSTLFSPFRQISADSTAMSLSDHIHIFFDKLLSRIIGSIVRSFMIITGLIVMLFQSILGIIILSSWLIIPLLPAVGLVGFAIGMVPQWTK